MKTSIVVVLSSVSIVLSGCISAERKEEHSDWLLSDDGVQGVSLETFESKYKQGWRERAEEKRKERLAREAKETAERERLAKERAEAERVRRAKEAEAERVRLAKEAAEQAEKMRLAMRTELYEKTVERDLAAIKKCYSEGERYENPFRGNRKRESEGKSDWLSKWASPRLNLTEADALAGEALLSEFGMKYLPNAYANYEKKRDALAELQQVFNEEFSQPWMIKNTSPKWNSFNKVLEKFVKARTECFLCHDELCHYWVSYRLGVLTAEDFAKIDSQKLAVKLLPENLSRAGYTIMKRQKLDGKDAEFAAKYAPESYAVYQRFEQEQKQFGALLGEVYKQRILLDCVRFSRAFYNANFKFNDIVREMNALIVDFQTWHTDHRTTEKSSEDVAKCDQERARGLKAFADSLPTYVRDRTLGRIVSAGEMIPLGSMSVPVYHVVQSDESSADILRRYGVSKEDLISANPQIEGRGRSDMIGVRLLIPNKKVTSKVSLQRTELTQMQWMIVMGNNPSHHVKPDCPVENVSWNDCQLFIKKLNEMDGVNYRLPNEVEWTYACRAGAKGDWGKRRNGEEGPLDAIGWYYGNNRDNRGSRAVALKEPNAFGFFDMHGNVCEWCEEIGDADGKDPVRGRRRFARSRRGSNYVCCGGHCGDRESECTVSHRDYKSPDGRYNFIGFRLAATQD